MNQLLKTSLLLFVAGVECARAATIIGPVPYLRYADSPFSALSGWEFSYLETWTDGILDTPGVTANGIMSSTRFTPNSFDSVDEDDGVIDGTCSIAAVCDTLWEVGSDGIRFTFDSSVLGALPTHVGLAWTDGAGGVRFEAFGPGGVSLGVFGPDITIPDSVFTSTTGEDRFFGAINAAGIESILVSNTTGGIEVDHLQYGLRAVPEPAAFALCGVGLAGLVVAKCSRVRRSLPWIQMQRARDIDVEVSPRAEPSSSPESTASLR